MIEPNANKINHEEAEYPVVEEVAKTIPLVDVSIEPLFHSRNDSESSLLCDAKIVESDQSSSSSSSSSSFSATIIIKTNNDKNYHLKALHHNHVTQQQSPPADLYGPQEMNGYCRPEYIFCQVIKPSPNACVGLLFKGCKQDKGQRNSGIYITRIVENGLFGRAGCLRPGDRIMSVNNVSVTDMKATDVLKLIKDTPRTLTITVWNQGGDPTKFSSTIQKPKSDAKLGIAFKNDKNGFKLLRVTKVHKYSLFFDSLLLPGQQCYMINGIACRNTPSEEAVTYLRAADGDTYSSDFVTIVSGPGNNKSEYATVLCCEEDRIVVGGQDTIYGQKKQISVVSVDSDGKVVNIPIARAISVSSA